MMLSRSYIEHKLEVEFKKTKDFPSEPHPREALVIDESLHQVLESTSDFFHEGEWQVLRPGRQFLSTVGVLTCITVLAWTNKGKHGPDRHNETITFGAHIDAEYYYGGKRFTSNGDPYSFLLRLLSGAFKQIDPSDITCFIVGGHSRGCPGEASQTMGDELLASLRLSGYQVDTSLYKIFPGATVREWDANIVNFTWGSTASWRTPSLWMDSTHAPCGP